MAAYHDPKRPTCDNNAYGLLVDKLQAEYLKRYGKKATELGDKISYNEGQQHYREAIGALSDYNKVNNTDTDTKSAILMGGILSAFEAATAFLWIIDTYHAKMGLPHSWSNAPESIDPDKYTSYMNLYHEIYTTPNFNRAAVLKNFMTANNYTKQTPNQFEYERKYYDVGIYEFGLKIYHLKTMIDFCEDLMKAINLLNAKNATTSMATSTKTAEQINKYFSAGNSKWTSLNIFYQDYCTGDPAMLTKDQLLELCVRCRNMFIDYLSAIMIMEYPDTDLSNKDLLDMYTEVSQFVNLRSSRMLDDYSDTIIEILIITDEQSVENIRPIKLVNAADRAIDIASVLKMDISNFIANRIYK